MNDVWCPSKPRRSRRAQRFVSSEFEFRDRIALDSRLRQSTAERRERKDCEELERHRTGREPLLVGLYANPAISVRLVDVAALGTGLGSLQDDLQILETLPDQSANLLGHHQVKQPPDERFAGISPGFAHSRAIVEPLYLDDN